MIEKLTSTGKTYLNEMDLEDMAALKLCLTSLGVLIGLGIPLKGKKPVALLAGFLFTGTYIPLMCRLWEVFNRKPQQENDGE
jgi:hypothetical protein